MDLERLASVLLAVGVLALSLLAVLRYCMAV